MYADWQRELASSNPQKFIPQERGGNAALHLEVSLVSRAVFIRLAVRTSRRKLSHRVLGDGLCSD